MYLKDPKTHEESVSLTIVVLAFLGALVANGLQMSGLVENTASSMELFYACAGLYWGRKFTSNKAGVLEGEGEEPSEKKE